MGGDILDDNSKGIELAGISNGGAVDSLPSWLLAMIVDTVARNPVNDAVTICRASLSQSTLLQFHAILRSGRKEVKPIEAKGLEVFATLFQDSACKAQQESVARMTLIPSLVTACG